MTKTKRKKSMPNNTKAGGMASAGLRPLNKFSRKQLTIFALIFAAIGGYILFRSFAAAPLVATLQGEQMSLPAGSLIRTDSTASGGQDLELRSTSTTSGTVSFPSQVSSLTVMAKGDQCGGAPLMNVSLDGTKVMTGTSVSSTSWTAY